MLSPRLTIARPLRLSNTKASNQVPLWYPAPRRTRTRCYTTNGTSIHTHPSSNPSAHPIHARSFHASAKFASPSTDTYSDEASVPKYYKERKSRKDEDVMEHLSDSAFSDEIAASTRRMAAKIPLQFFTDQGELIHPSGYIPPSPGDAPRRRDRQQDLAKQTAAVAERVLEEDFEDVEAALKTYKGKVPFEFQHEDGSTSHPSGFVPPTPAHMFGSYQPPSNPTNATSVNPKPYGNPKSQETDPRPQDKGDKAKQLSDIDQRKQEESNLMKELVSGVLERGVSASTEPKQEKVPKTVKESDGNKETAQYPAGFAPESIGKRS